MAMVPDDSVSAISGIPPTYDLGSDLAGNAKASAALPNPDQATIASVASLTTPSQAPQEEEFLISEVQDLQRRINLLT